MKKRVIIFGNGRLNKGLLKHITSDDYIIGVDRAAYWLITRGIVPHMAIGDFDSATAIERQVIKKSVKKFKTFPPDKNWTDMELAVNQAVRLSPDEVVIFGGSGTRLDHTMATWHVLDSLLKKNITHSLTDETNSIRLLGKGRTIFVPRGYRYISVLPFTRTVVLELQGFKYNVPKMKLVQGSTRGISNEIAGREAAIRIYSGKAWVVESND